MKIAYVCHHDRYNYEYTWFASLPVETVRFITTDAKATSDKPNVEYRVIEYEEKGLENRFFASTAKRVFYKNFEKDLEDIDVVVVLEVFSSLSRQFVEYCKKIGKPVAVLVYELIPTHPIYKIPRYRGNTKYVLANADSFICVSNAAADHLVALGAPKQKITTVYPGFNLEIFKPDRTNRHPQSLMFVGKLEVHKGIDILINVYRRLAPDFPNLPLTIIGDGSWRPQVEALAQEFPAVSYHQRIPNSDIPNFLNKRSIYLLPARDTKRLGQRIGAEQVGFTLVEAMACGLAVITTTCGALPEIAGSENIIIPQNSTEALYTATRGLLEDPDRVQKLGMFNQEQALRRFDMKTQSQQLADVLSSLQER